MNQIKGFTPAVDFITEEHGGTISLIYGAIWRYAQQSPLNICNASQEKIGKRAGVSRESVNKNIPTMIDEGLIKKTGKGPGGTISYTPLIDISSIFIMGVNLVHSDSEDSSHEDVTEVHTKKDNKKDTKNIIADGIEVYESITGAIRKNFRLSPSWDTKANRNHYQFLRERYDAGQFVGTFARWWWTEQWQGQQGQAPTMNQIREMWYMAFEKREEQKDPLNIPVKEY